MSRFLNYLEYSDLRGQICVADVESTSTSVAKRFDYGRYGPIPIRVVGVNNLIEVMMRIRKPIGRDRCLGYLLRLAIATPVLRENPVCVEIIEFFVMC